MCHSFVLNRSTGLALVLAAVLTGCGGGEAGSGSSGEAAARMEQAAAVQAPAPPRRAPVDPLLRSTNAAANQALQLKCNQTLAARARNYTLAYGDRMRQRRLTDLCISLATLPG